MIANLYFLIQKDSYNSVSILNGPDYLPVTFLNISNFNNLEQNDPQLIKDLSWADRPDLGFWIAKIGSKPPVSFNTKIVSENILDISSETITVNYSEIELSAQEKEQKKQMLKNRYTPMRDSYLKLTDFTQLADAPISEQAKADFLVFRQQLRAMFDILDYSQLTWPPIPTSAPNITIPPFPPIDFS
jgi:hypothetical protein